MLTLTKPHLTRTPQPTKFIPFTRAGNNISVAGSFVGDNMTGSDPNGDAAEHCAAVLLLSLILLVVYNNVAPASKADPK